MTGPSSSPKLAYDRATGFDKRSHATGPPIFGPPCISRGRVCVRVSTLRFTAAPLTVAYDRQRDARVAYVHNTVHRYTTGLCGYFRSVCVHVAHTGTRAGTSAVPSLCACVRAGCLRRCVEDGATTRVADRNCEVEAMIEPVLQHIVYPRSDAADVQIVASAGRRRHSTRRRSNKNPGARLHASPRFS